MLLLAATIVVGAVVALGLGAGLSYLFDRRGSEESAMPVARVVAPRERA